MAKHTQNIVQYYADMLIAGYHEVTSCSVGRSSLFASHRDIETNEQYVAKYQFAIRIASNHKLDMSDAVIGRLMRCNSPQEMGDRAKSMTMKTPIFPPAKIAMPRTRLRATADRLIASALEGMTADGH
jgi:hypothetical protein